MFDTASLLDSSSMSVPACTALAEIGRRNPLPLRDHSLPVDDKPASQMTTGSVIDNLINKVKSTSENAKVSHSTC